MRSVSGLSSALVSERYSSGVVGVHTRRKR